MARGDTSAWYPVSTPAAASARTRVRQDDADVRGPASLGADAIEEVDLRDSDRTPASFRAATTGGRDRRYKRPMQATSGAVLQPYGCLSLA
jgi:hypothetical protein